MKLQWSQASLEDYIRNEVQESLSLDYKASDSLSKESKKKTEITKDVSAMANSAGGIIIYGIREFQDPAKKHLPEKIDPVDLTIFSKEWLEHIINNIRPRIEGIIIHPVPISSASNHTIYVVEIPQSTTAHQADDWRYYKRYNFSSIPMEDYEIRDIMGRRKHPRIELSFEIEISTGHYTVGIDRKSISKSEYTLCVLARNIGPVYAQYVNAFIRIPYLLAYQDEFDQEQPLEQDGYVYCEYYEDNTVRDLIDMDVNIYSTIKKYGPARFDPILPGRAHIWRIKLTDNFAKENLDNLIIKWSVNADNAPPSEGEIFVTHIKVVDRRES